MAKTYPWETGQTATQTSTQLKNAQSATAAENFVKTLEQNFMQAGAGQYTGAGARFSGAKNSILGALGLNDPAKVYNDSRKGFAATLKQLTGDTGVMTDQDYERLAGLLPTLSSTPGEASQKFEQLRSQIQAKFGGELQPSEYQQGDIKGGLLSALLPGLSGMYQQKQETAQNTMGKLESGDIGGYLKGVTNESLKNLIPAANIYNPSEGYNPQSAQAAGEVLSVLGLTDLAKAGLSKTKLLGQKGALANRTNVATQSTSQISGDDIYNAAKSQIEKTGGIDKEAGLKLLEKTKDDLVGKTLNATEALDKLSTYNKAYTQAGKVGKSARALVNDALSKATRSTLPQDVATAQNVLKSAYQRPKDVRKWLSTLGLTAGGVGGGVYLLSLLTGKKQ